MKRFEIKITESEDGGDDIFMDLKGSANDALGLISRTRFELDCIERRIFDEIENRSAKSSKTKKAATH